MWSTCGGLRLGTGEVLERVSVPFRVVSRHVGSVRPLRYDCVRAGRVRTRRLGTRSEESVPAAGGVRRRWENGVSLRTKGRNEPISEGGLFGVVRFNYSAGSFGHRGVAGGTCVLGVVALGPVGRDRDTDRVPIPYQGSQRGLGHEKGTSR